MIKLYRLFVLLTILHICNNHSKSISIPIWTTFHIPNPEVVLLCFCKQLKGLHGELHILDFFCYKNSNTYLHVTTTTKNYSINSDVNVNNGGILLSVRCRTY